MPINLLLDKAKIARADQAPTAKESVQLQFITPPCPSFTPSRSRNMDIVAYYVSEKVIIQSFQAWKVILAGKFASLPETYISSSLNDSEQSSIFTSESRQIVQNSRRLSKGGTSPKQGHIRFNSIDLRE